MTTGPTPVPREALPGPSVAEVVPGSVSSVDARGDRPQGPPLERAAAPDRAPRARTAQFNERSAREVLLLRAYETLNSDAEEHPLWTRADTTWASRVASESVGNNTDPAAFLKARAHAAMQRLAPRDAGVRQALAMRGWRWGWVALVALIGLTLGAVVYDVGTHQRIDLLSLPVWAIVAWNLAMYAVLLVAWVRGLSKPGWQGGRLRRFIGGRLASRVSGVSRKTPALANYAASWSKASWPMTVARAGVVLHVGAAALALGLIAGMYVRGTVLDYRAGWQSTFLEPPRVHALLSTALAPASWLTRVPLPDEASIGALRVLPGVEAKGNAADWIHLYAATLALFVVLPRGLLALGSLLRGAWLSRRLPLAIDEPYHQRLLQHHRTHASSVRVHAHGVLPDAQAALGLQRLVTRVFGDKAELSLAPLAQYGAEEVVVNSTALESDGVKLALFDLSATPESEAQGRFVQALQARSGRGGTVLMLVDEASFNSRFGVDGERAQQRRAAWVALADKLGLPHPVFLNLASLNVDAAAHALETAIGKLDARD